MKRILIIGSTGSVGKNALQVAREFPGEFEVMGISACSNYELLARQAKEFAVKAVSLEDAKLKDELESLVSEDTKLFFENDGLIEMIKSTKADVVIAASSGSSALKPVLEAIRANENVAIANKEILVMAGSLIMSEAKKHQVKILPVDSEHNAIFQCLEGNASHGGLKQILLTGSGGPLKDISEDKFSELTKEQVLNHPKWKMGQKITVDSATMMNKGLEIIEAKWLFDIEPDQIKVVVHPEAIVHSMIEFIDGSILAQMGITDMKLPLIHSMSYPGRINYPSLSIDLTQIGSLHFENPKETKFPCLGLAKEVAKKSTSTLAAVLNATDEVAVHAFLNGGISFVEIPKIIEKVLSSHQAIEAPELPDILNADRWAREEALRYCGASSIKES